MGRIRTEYIETGKVRFIYKHFAILGPESNRAAEASECAAEQDQFWAFHDIFFVDQGDNRSQVNDAQLISLASEIGLETTAFSECLASGRYTDLIRQESATVQSLGVRGTPGFVLNGLYIAGAQPYEVFQQAIDEQLAALEVDSSAGGEAPPQETVSPESTDREVTGTEGQIEGLVVFATQPQTHQEGEIDYNHEVPPGGAHNAAWQNCGIYDQPVPLETTMHSLEHGAVWIAYQPQLLGDQVRILRSLVQQELPKRDEPMIILSPNPDLEVPILATAWRVQLELDSPLDPRLLRFLQQYQVGPFTPEPGAPCSGGLGEPLE